MGGHNEYSTRNIFKFLVVQSLVCSKIIFKTMSLKRVLITHRLWRQTYPYTTTSSRNNGPVYFELSV